MKHLQYLFIILAATLASCTSHSFRIDGNLAKLDGTAVHVIFSGDSGTVDEWVNVDKKGRFTIKGQSAEPTLVNIMDQRGKALINIVAVNGDHLKFKGDASKAMGIKVKGNRLNEEWQLFRDEHAAFYTDTNPSRLDASIEKYVREHPADLLSTVLLVADYSDFADREKVQRLLNGLDKSVKPESLTRAITAMGKKANLPRMMTLTLWVHGKGFKEIDLRHRITLLNMWALPANGREALIKAVTALGEETSGAVNVVDVLVESDTLQWHKIIADDPDSWQHCWAPGGPLEQGIQLLSIKSAPWYAVTDSTGLVTYSGPDLNKAISTAREQVK